MPLLLWLALFLGYLAGAGAAVLFLPRPVVEPHHATAALVGVGLALGLGVVAFLTYRRRTRLGRAGAAPGEVRAQAGADAAPAPQGTDAAAPVHEAAPIGRDQLVSPTPPRLTPSELRHALQEGRVDLFVQALACVPPQLFAPYRALARLRGTDGQPLEPQAYLPTAAGCGRLGLIDQIYIVRAAHAIRRAAAEGHEVRLFCALTPASLGDPEVLAEIAEFLAERPELAERLVVEVDRVRLNRPSDQALARLRRLGLRLCLRRFMPSGLDTRLLIRRGISFVRLEQPPDAIRRDRAGFEEQLATLRRSLDDAGITLALDHADGTPVKVELPDHPIGLGATRSSDGARSSAA